MTKESRRVLWRRDTDLEMAGRLYLAAAQCSVRQRWVTLPVFTQPTYSLSHCPRPHHYQHYHSFSTSPPTSSSQPSPATSRTPLRCIKGTHDLFPPRSTHLNHLTTLLSNLATRYNYQPIHTPHLEPTPLFTRSLASSDVVRHELFQFSDHGTDTVLRPEGTAPVVRAVIGRGRGGGGVERYYYAGAMFRRERPQRGRYRQFQQFGVECIGDGAVMADIECVVMAYDALVASGLQAERLQLQINSLGDDSSRQRYVAALSAYLADRQSELSDESQRRLKDGHVLRILDSKAPQDRRIIEGDRETQPTTAAPLLSEYLSEERKARFAAVLKGLDGMNVTYSVNPFLVRGLDYYTDTTFEFLYTSSPSHSPASSSSSSSPTSSTTAASSSSDSAPLTVLAGGRYDDLFSTLGGPATPAIGWAIGLDRLLLTLQEERVEPAHDDKCVAVLAVTETEGDSESGSGGVASEEVRLEVLRVCRQLRAAGVHAVHALEKGKVSKQLAWAAKAGVRASVIVGRDEMRKQVVQVKDMRQKQQAEIDRDALVEYVQRLVGQSSPAPLSS